MKNIRGVRDKKIPIAIKMQVMTSLFLLVVFSVIFVSFNLSINTYAKHESDVKLSQAVNSIVNTNMEITIYGVKIVLNTIPKNDIQSNPYYYQLFYRAVIEYLSDPKFNLDMTILICDADYNRVYPNDASLLLEPASHEKMDSVRDALKKSRLPSYDKISRCSTKYGNYFYTSIDLDEMYGFTGLNLVIYTNADKYNDFIANTNVTLIIILLAAMAMSVIYVLVLSRNISKPITALSSFADEIGRGNFSQRDFNFRDRELFDLNNRMNVTAKKLMENDNDQKTFFQNVSHELKTPLMSIKGYAEGIKYGVFGGGETENAAEIIMSEADRLNELVADLLYISKMDSGKLCAEFSVVDLNELTDSALGRLRGILVNSDKKLIFNPNREPCPVKCDESSLIRAILNITANCIQYARTKVEITVGRTPDSTTISIKDDGSGISAGDLPHIFKRFYKGKNGKHGLGLSIAKSIAEQHGAEIFVKSDNSGAEFILSFPHKIITTAV